MTELQTFLTSMLDADVRERHNQVEVSFAPGVDPAAEIPRVKQLAWAWQVAGHVDVRTEIAVVTHAE